MSGWKCSSDAALGLRMLGNRVWLIPYAGGSWKSTLGNRVCLIPNAGGSRESTLDQRASPVSITNRSRK